MEKPGDGKSVVKHCLLDMTWLLHSRTRCNYSSRPRSKQPRFEWAVLIRSNELLKEKEEGEIKEGDMLGCFWEEWEERVGMDLIMIYCIHIENCQRIIPTYS